jgi:hypothetical protein
MTVAGHKLVEQSAGRAQIGGTLTQERLERRRDQRRMTERARVWGPLGRHGAL